MKTIANSVISVALWTQDRKALRTNQHSKELFQQSDLAHAPSCSHPSLTATQSSSWHHNRVVPPLPSITSLSPSFMSLPAFFSLGPFFAPPRQGKTAHMLMLSWQMAYHGKTRVSSSQGWTLKDWTDVRPSAHCHQCQGLFIPILDFYSAKWPGKPLVPVDRSSPPALQTRAATSHYKAAGSSQWAARRLQCLFPQHLYAFISEKMSLSYASAVGHRCCSGPDTQNLSCREGEAHHTRGPVCELPKQGHWVVWVVCGPARN